MERQLKREVKIGNVTIGGTNPVAVQTMLNVPIRDVEGNVAQAKRVAALGCQILRASVPTLEDVRIVEAIKNAVDIPFVADIHFDYRIALACVEAGADKIRINPGNIGSDENVRAVARACNAKNIPIRIGVNAGSLEKEILARYGAPTPEAMVESAMYHVRLLEKHDFNNIVISIKSSNVPRMMAAYRLLSQQCDYPLHVGVTEAGTYRMGLIKSGMGIGGLLLDGIGEDGSLKEGARDAVMEELRRHFRPEFLNRVDETVLFLPLRRDQVTRIVDLQMDRLRKRLEERKITLGITDAAREFIAGEAYDPVYGARPLKRYVQQYVETPLARELVSRPHPRYCP